MLATLVSPACASLLLLTLVCAAHSACASEPPADPAVDPSRPPPDAPAVPPGTSPAPYPPFKQTIPPGRTYSPVVGDRSPQMALDHAVDAHHARFRAALDRRCDDGSARICRFREDYARCALRFPTEGFLTVEFERGLPLPVGTIFGAWLPADGRTSLQSADLDWEPSVARRALRSLRYFGALPSRWLHPDRGLELRADWTCHLATGSVVLLAEVTAPLRVVHVFGSGRVESPPLDQGQVILGVDR